MKMLTKSRLNFGCGRDIKKGYQNVDISDFKGVDQTFDFNQFPYPIKDNTFCEIYCDNVLEHLENIPSVLKELHRISQNHGQIRIIVPYYHCYGAFNDVTHLHYFSHKSFEAFYQNVPNANYFIKEKFNLVKLTFIPTRIGRLIPIGSLRLFLSHIFGQIIQTIDITLEVIK